MKLRHTRRIIDAIHNGELGRAQYSQTPIFNLHIPKTVTDVPDDILTPEQQWSDRAAFSKVGRRNATFVDNIRACGKGGATCLWQVRACCLWTCPAAL